MGLLVVVAGASDDDSWGDDVAALGVIGAVALVTLVLVVVLIAAVAVRAAANKRARLAADEDTVD